MSGKAAIQTSRRALAGVAAALFVTVMSTPALAAPKKLKDEVIPFGGYRELPERVPPLIEIGPKFLGPGELSEGFELPTGAVWNPAFWVYGSQRTALNYFDDGVNPETFEWANRLDLFGNLRLTGTERLMVGISPLSDEGEFSGYTFQPGSRDGGDEEFNLELTRLFFEGEFGEIFPDLDPDDSGMLDFGFSVGRQPLFFQEGIMVNDIMDTVALTRDTIIIPGLSVDTRLTALMGWNEVNRDDNQEDTRAELYGLFGEGDFGESTVQFDLAYVDGRNDGVYLGLGSVQRPAVFNYLVNTAVRINTSFAPDNEGADVSEGTLLFSEASITPHGTSNVLYANSFLGLEEYASAARGDTQGGPLGRTGILFEAVGLGEFGAPLSNRADSVAGGSIGYQMFFNHEDTQVILETGGRVGLESSTSDQISVGTRFQQAVGDRFIFRVDGFVTGQERGDTATGLRTELVTQF